MFYTFEAYPVDAPTGISLHNAAQPVAHSFVCRRTTSGLVVSLKTSQASSLVVLDLAGRRLWSSQQDNASDYTIPGSALSAGIRIVRVITGNQRYTQTIAIY